MAPFQAASPSSDKASLSSFKLSASELARFQFAPVDAKEFTPETNKLRDRTPDFHIYGVVCFARDEEEQKKIRNLIAEARQDKTKRNLVMIDASGAPMGAERFDEWAKFAGSETYWRDKDTTIADTNHKHAEKQLKDWREAVEDGTFLVYYGEQRAFSSDVKRTRDMGR